MITIDDLFPAPTTAPTLAEFRAAFGRAHNELHRLWTAEVGTPGYEKRPWRDLDNALSARGRDVANAIGIPSTEPLIATGAR